VVRLSFFIVVVVDDGVTVVRRAVVAGLLAIRRGPAATAFEDNAFDEGLVDEEEVEEVEEVVAVVDGFGAGFDFDVDGLSLLLLLVLVLVLVASAFAGDARTACLLLPTLVRVDCAADETDPDLTSCRGWYNRSLLRTRLTTVSRRPWNKRWNNVGRNVSVVASWEVVLPDLLLTGTSSRRAYIHSHCNSSSSSLSLNVNVTI